MHKMHKMHNNIICNHHHKVTKGITKLPCTFEGNGDIFIRGRVETMFSYSHGLACDILFITSSTISKKLQDDCETAKTTLPPAGHFPDILSKQIELHLEVY